MGIFKLIERDYASKDNEHKKREVTKTLFDQLSAKYILLLIVALLKGEQSISRGETLFNIGAKKKMDKWLN
jgi:hypothetical protein